MFDLNADPNAKKYIPGYTGHIPTNWSESDFEKDKCSYYIPKYNGFVPGIRCENIHGKTFGEATALAISGDYTRGFVQPATKIYQSTAQEAFDPNKKDYFFSFSRLTDVRGVDLTQAEKEQAKHNLKKSMELKVLHGTGFGPGQDHQKIDLSYEQIAAQMQQKK